jgi:hypothetical protein
LWLPHHNALIIAYIGLPCNNELISRLFRNNDLFWLFINESAGTGRSTGSSGAWTIGWRVENDVVTDPVSTWSGWIVVALRSKLETSSDSSGENDAYRGLV